MTVAICDDEAIFRSKLRALLIEYKKARRIPIDVLEFADGDLLLASKDAFDIVFLDYQMPNLDGMETARILRMRNCTCCIIFATNFPEFMIDSFEVQPYRFYIKPIDKEKLFSTLDKFVKNQNALAPVIINEDGEQKIISSKEIIYLEGDGKYCYLRTANGIVHSSKTLQGIYQLLPKHCFYRIHKSYVINMYCVASIDGDIITLTNGEKAPISRNRKSDFKRAFKQFVETFYIRL